MPIKDEIMYTAMACDNIDNMSEICLMKSCKISSSYNINYSPWILPKFCTEHGSVTAVLCAKFQKDSWIQKEAMDNQDLERFQLKMGFGWNLYIVIGP